MDIKLNILQIIRLISGVDTSVAVPLPCANVCRLDIVADEHKVENSNSHIVRWTGILPLKLPTLLIKIEKSLENEKLGNSTLKAHFAALQEEWAKYNYIVYFVLIFNNYKLKPFLL